MPINYGNFDTAQSLLQRSIFIIPTFQRPYAWETVHLNDLFDDVRAAACSDGRIHYISPIHVLKVDNTSSFEWVKYTDVENDDIEHLNRSNFTDKTGLSCDVYLVVDGQQRLTTLYMALLHLLGPVHFTVTLQSGNVIPRLILNPPDDHYKFCQILGIRKPSHLIESKAQSRLVSAFSEIKSLCEKSSEDEKIVLKAGLKTILIELNANYALKGFLSLNSRGKNLTHFEMLKSLLMEFDLGYGTQGNAHNIHDAFSIAYKALNSSYLEIRPRGDRRELFDDDDFFVVLSIDIFRINEILNENTSKIFSRYRSERPEREQLHDRWLPRLRSLSEQVASLNSWLQPTHDTGNQPYGSLGRTVTDHYRIVIDFLEISRRSIAVALKFRALHDVELHEKKYTVTVENQDILAPLISDAAHLFNRIKQIGRDADIPTESHLARLTMIQNELQRKFNNKSQNRQMSLLDIAEWIELFVVQANSRKSYADQWKASFSPGRSATDAFVDWANFAAAYNLRRNFFKSIKLGLAESKRKVVSYVLHEYECHLRMTDDPKNKHLPHSERLDLEHFFPQNNIVGEAAHYGIKRNEYEEIVDGLGNLFLLDSNLNRALKDEMPAVKFNGYLTGRHGDTVAQERTRMSELFAQQQAPDRLLKAALEVRRLEIILFAIERF